MLLLLIVALLLFAFWVIYGRGALIVYHYKNDEGTPIPENMDKDQVKELLNNQLGYPDTKEIFFDENGDICIAGKYDTYAVQIENGRIYMNDPLYTEVNEDINQTMTLLQKIGRFRIRARKKRNRDRVEELLCIRAYITKLFNHNAPVNAHKKHTEMVRARKYSRIVSLVCIILCVVLFVVAISSGSNNQKIDSIKSSNLTAYSTQVSIGRAIDDFFANPSWESYSENGTDFVKCSGEISYYDNPALAVITFEFMEQDWFRVSKITVNGELLTAIETDAFLTVIFESYGT